MQMRRTCRIDVGCAANDEASVSRGGSSGTSEKMDCTKMDKEGGLPVILRPMGIGRGSRAAGGV